jgi:dienelactone hydrolase
VTEQTQLGLAVRTESLHVNGARIAVTVRRPADLAPNHALPAVVMGIGFAGVRGGYLRNFAETFARAGTTTFAFDYRGFGDSEGSPRQEVDPWAQISDYRDVLRFAKGYPGVDPESIVVWGSSLSGGHAIVLAATDPTVKCAIAQVPHVSGVAALQRTFTDQMRAVLMAALDHDRAQRLCGSTPGTIAVIDDGQGRPAAVYSTPEAIESYTFSRDHLAGVSGLS